jgi:hypothetical protein
MLFVVDAAKTTLTTGQGAVLLAVVIAGSLLAGIVVIVGRKVVSGGADGPQSIVRSWLAISLVFGLLSFCAAAFEIDDPQVRSTLLGGLVASAGAATAFYFSSKGADKARSDILATATTLAHRGVPPGSFSAAAPPAATAGTEYSYSFVADGTPPLTYALSGGPLPAGLELDLDGKLHGTPAAAGSTTFSVVARNSLGSLSSDTVTLTVNAADG